VSDVERAAEEAMKAAVQRCADLAHELSDAQRWRDLAIAEWDAIQAEKRNDTRGRDVADYERT
jgi:hypothetical protein